MDYAGDRWVRRLRDGVIPRRWPLVVGLSVAALAGAAIGWAELSHPFVVTETTRLRSAVALVILPIGLIALGPIVAVGTWFRSRDDRKTLARIRAGSTPAFHLPVDAPGHAVAETVRPTGPVVWTVDGVGLHAWTPDDAEPIIDLPWSEIEGFDLSQTVSQGMEVATGIIVTAAEGPPLLLTCRSTLGRPYPAGATKIDILMRVLRSLRRELDRSTV
ncbi:hypothetical protein AS850_01935 [Frondihabitans sp. 762G35]|uniref:hypothetical protein n=1 Tax=Frondihabitans sp. 762G35 TaxID=1446794 RepID=UPI000D201D29|nr:hypothetical protein [Frondihabitans sp. 762G35]ARC55838.1 hypothetical protein AS850_01935 [Frondihabitans sp. 762G35]